MKIRIIGTGSWATALCQVLLDNGRDVFMYGVSEVEVNDINNKHRNDSFFDVDLPLNMHATMKMEDIADADIILLATPVKAIESVMNELTQILDHPVYFISVSKGFHPLTHERLSVFIKRVAGEKCRDVISLIGPSHAEEVVLRLLTSVNAVCEDEDLAKMVQELFSCDYFRVYRNTDVIGAEIAAACKNVFAIASGILDGLKQGDNARAALMTRGLYEMTRFGLYYGGKMETFLGLNGVGDLIVTCSSRHSRNFNAGFIIGQDDDAAHFLKENTKTTEGVATAKVVYEMAKKNGLYMPITDKVYQVLYEGKKPSIAIKELMSRSLKAEEL